MGKYEDLATRIGKLVDEKNVAYGDAVGTCGSFLRVYFPDGVPVEKYQEMLYMVRCHDKFSRIATAPDAFGESPWHDVAGYGILAAAHSELEREHKQNPPTRKPQVIHDSRCKVFFGLGCTCDAGVVKTEPCKSPSSHPPANANRTEPQDITSSPECCGHCKPPAGKITSA